MKILNMIILFLAIMTSIALFNFHDTGTDYLVIYNANYSNYSAAYNYSYQTVVNGSTYDSNIIWKIFETPFSGGGLAIIAMVILLGIYIGIVGYFNIIGFGYRSDMAMISPMFIFLVGIGLIPTGVLYNFLYSETNAYACTAAMTSCWAGGLVAGTISGILLIMWVVACIEWWMQRSMSN